VSKRLPGKAWLAFKLFGLDWQARTYPRKHKELDFGAAHAFCDSGRRLMGFANTLSNEQAATALAHEVQHAIEEHADIDYEVATTSDVADRMTDQVSRGWLYIIRDCPELLAVFKQELK
jgi:hypothetical protein